MVNDIQVNFGLIILVAVSGAFAAEKHDTVLTRVERNLDQVSHTKLTDPNSPAFLQALGHVPMQTNDVKPKLKIRSLTLIQCLQESFINNDTIKQVREDMLAVGGSKLIASSRFQPSVELISQYERIENLDIGENAQDSTSLGIVLSQRILEYGKDHPIDVALRQEQRDTLFTYENTIVQVFSDVRRAFYYILLKQAQITTRQELLQEFQKQYERKRQRLEADNLSVKIEVLTARLNVLNEQTRINRLERQQFNRKMELLRLIGLPVGADSIQLQGQSDSFGLNGFNINIMAELAVAQSSQVALAEVLVSEQKRVLDQLKYEYIPDLRFMAGYQDRNGRIGLNMGNDNGTWGMDLYGQSAFTQDQDHMDGRGLFGAEARLQGPNRGSFAGVQMRIPMFDGRQRQGRRIQNQAYLFRLRAALADSKNLIELYVRQHYKLLVEQQFQVELAQENVAIERERFSIQEQLRDVGRIDDDALERFRENFFRAQDNLFQQQEVLVQRQEDLRETIRLFR